MQLTKKQRTELSDMIKKGLRKRLRRGHTLGRPLKYEKLIPKIHRLRDQGCSYRDIGEKLNISHSTAYRLFNFYDFK